MYFKRTHQTGLQWLCMHDIVWIMLFMGLTLKLVSEAPSPSRQPKKLQGWKVFYFVFNTVRCVNLHFLGNDDDWTQIGRKNQLHTVPGRCYWDLKSLDEKSAGNIYGNKNVHIPSPSEKIAGIAVPKIQGASFTTPRWRLLRTVATMSAQCRMWIFEYVFHKLLLW